MIYDIEGNKITLADVPNGHLLTLGSSGMGKTYFACRQMEEKIQQGKHIRVIDFSGSFTPSELLRNGFQYINEVVTVDLSAKGCCVELYLNDFVDDFAESILGAFGIQSYYQRTLLGEAITRLVVAGQAVSFPKLMRQLESMMQEMENERSRENIWNLLNRFEPLRKVEVLFGPGDMCRYHGRNFATTIMEINAFPALQRRFLALLMTEIFWKETFSQHRTADIVLLDEFQNLGINEHHVVATMIREGRKFGLSVWLFSQLIGCYKKGMVETLMQAANMVFFRPTEREVWDIAGWIAPMDKRPWVDALLKLEVGQAIIKGNYHVAENNRICSHPILCRIN